MPNDDRKPWERQPDETDRAWAAFRVYRDLPPAERSYGAAFRKTYQKPANYQAPQWYRQWANRHGWRDRVEAWDRHLDDVGRAVTERERVEWRGHRRKLLQGFLSNVATAMREFDPKNVSVGQLTQAVQMLVQEMRAEMDDLPTEKRQLTGAEGGPIQITTVEVIKDYGHEPVPDS